MKVSTNQLSELTGKDRRTLKRLLEPLTPEIDGRAHLYESVIALQLIYEVDADGGMLDLQQERAHLARAQTAELHQIKIDEAKNRLLIDAVEVKRLPPGTRSSSVMAFWLFPAGSPDLSSVWTISMKSIEF